MRQSLGFNIAAAFVAGALFAAGLATAAMTQPSKVQGFLNVTGAWDPSLAFVMIGAIAVHFIAYRRVVHQQSPWFDAKFHLPKVRKIDPKLIIGSALFGVGWGLGGYCPGPSLVAAGGGSAEAIVFVAAMTLGMVVTGWLTPRKSREQDHTGAQSSTLRSTNRESRSATVPCSENQ